MYGYRDGYGYRERDDRSRDRHHRRERSSSRDDHNKRKRRRSRSDSNPRHHHYKQRSRSRSREKRHYVDSYEEWEGEETEQRLRMAIRNNEIQFDAKLLQMLRSLPAAKQQELTIEAHSSEKIHEYILVRELFISGLTEMNEAFIESIMKQYGDIEKIQIIKNFAYVKFHKVEDASNACAEYHKINSTIHNNTHNANFKIFFADHVKRWNVVSNSPNYEKKDDLVPVLYASIRGEMPFNNESYLRDIFGKFGFVRNVEIKMNDLPGPKTYKSYILVEFQTLAQAIRARDRIKLNREHYLGDRKSEVTILIDSDKLTRDQPNVKNQLRYQRRKQISSLNTNIVTPQIAVGSSFGSNMNMNITQEPATNAVAAETNDIMAMIRDYADKEEMDQEESDWVGFMTRNKQFKVEVDFKLIHKVPFQLDTLLNVSHRADLKEGINREDYVMAGKFRAANTLNIEAFNEYIRYFRKKGRAGIILTRNYLIYLIPLMEELSLPYPTRQDELLALFFKIE